MRKIIPYIASGFRKDKIWLRRTKASSRDYQVLLCMDDSSSMSTNEVKTTAYQSLATICQSLATLDVGKLGVVGFGDEARLLQPLKAGVAPEDGAHLLRKLAFDQKATNVARMLASARKAFKSCPQFSEHR